MQFSVIKKLIITWGLICLSGCSFFVSKATEDFGESLAEVILNHNDPKTIAEAIPTYLLLLETLILSEPDNEALLSSTATLYGSYVNLLSDDAHSRKKLLADKAFNFALQSSCIHNEKLCLLNKQQYQVFDKAISNTTNDDIDALYSLGSAWALWIQTHKNDWNAIAQLAQVKLIMSRVVELDESYQKGNAHVYLGVLATILPPALGGTPELGKRFFERAIKLSKDKNLMIKVIYARQYARMMFDRELHDKLLNAVMNAELAQPDLTLMNTLAQQQASTLLKSADEYF